MFPPCFNDLSGTIEDAILYLTPLDFINLGPTIYLTTVNPPPLK